MTAIVNHYKWLEGGQVKGRKGRSELERIHTVEGNCDEIGYSKKMRRVSTRKIRGLVYSCTYQQFCSTHQFSGSSTIVA